jgi:hypothetical protein
MIPQTLNAQRKQSFQILFGVWFETVYLEGCSDGVQGGSCSHLAGLGRQK